MNEIKIELPVNDDELYVTNISTIGCEIDFVSQGIFCVNFKYNICLSDVRELIEENNCVSIDEVICLLEPYLIK